MIDELYNYEIKVDNTKLVLKTDVKLTMIAPAEVTDEADPPMKVLDKTDSVKETDPLTELTDEADPPMKVVDETDSVKEMDPPTELTDGADPVKKVIEPVTELETMLQDIKHKEFINNIDRLSGILDSFDF